MEHNICPECGGYMSCVVKYYCGQLLVERQCSCGYMSLQQFDTITANTTSVRHTSEEGDT